MDTKSKKFDKLSIIRLVCVVLSVIFILTASDKVLSFISYLEENNTYEEFGDYLEYYFVGSDATSNNQLNRELDKFIDSALSKGLIYTSDTEKDYEEYLKKSADKYGEELVTALLYNRYFGSDYFVFYSLEKGYINLKKIDDITYSPGSSFFYNDGVGYREFYENPDNLGYYAEYADYYDDDFFETTYAAFDNMHSDSSSKKVYCRSENFSYSQYVGNYTELQEGREISFTENKNGAIYHSDINCKNQAAIDASRADAIVMIEDAYFGKTHYSGIYEITLSKDKLDPQKKESFVSTNQTFNDTKEEYYENCKSLDESLKQYKNAFFAVLDNTTGNFTTNLSSKGEKVTAENTEKLISRFNDEYVKFSNGVYNAHGETLSHRVGSLINSYSEALPSGENFTVWLAFDRGLSGGDDPFSKIDDSPQFDEGEFKSAVAYVIVGLSGWLICLIVLVFMTGRRSYDNDLHMGRFDSIFTILKTVINLGLIALSVWGTAYIIFENSFYYYNSAEQRYFRSITPGIKLLANAVCVLCSLILIDLVLYIARHIKNRSLLKNISVVKLSIYLYKRAKKKKALKIPRDAEYYDFRKKILRVMIPVLAVIDIAVIVFSFALSDYEGGEFLLIIPIVFAFEFFAVRWFLRYITSVREIFLSIHNMRTGEDVDYIDKDKMPKSLKAYADDVNSVSEGLSIAIMNATKEQRTKTELITNVSHDLKTPLTSIISYVDLLSKRPIEDEEAKKYIGVLGEKSEKLKKLIEDLVEASKASAGNVAVNLVKMSLHELVSQVVGEYEEDLSRRGLAIYIEEKEDDIIVSADSKLSSRVLDNLMINIKKYAMPGTRVYVRIYRESGYGCISVSNISEQQLNIPASELKERFVRGDESRSTEGSGLGLAIAEDFMSLQNGALELSINGDMFTAEVKFAQI